MKLMSVVLLTLASVGCRSYIEIFDVGAEREREEVVLRFKAQRDVTRSAQFIGASLRILPDDRAVMSIGADKLVCVEKKTDAPGSCYSFQARFPLKGEGVSRRRYDLTLPGRYELEFVAYGGMCGGPGGFYTNEVRIPYVVPETE